MQKRQFLFSLVFILILLGLDQFSKWIFYNQEIGVDFLFLEPLFNTGISRWIAMPMGVVLGISLVCVVLFSYLFGRRMFTMWEYGLFLAGALGNLRDRVLLGGVRDFIAVGTFPVFNFADAFLTMAVILLCIRQIFSCKTKVKS